MARDVCEVSLIRLYLLRLIYMLMAVALGFGQWRVLIERGAEAPLMTGIAHSMLAALGVISILGIRYPLQMLPVLFLEFLWKVVWLIAVALRLQIDGRLGPDFLNTAWECLPVVILPFIIPWRYVAANYIRKRGDRWR